MFMLLASAWRVIVNRSLSDWLILSAALITVLISTTLLAAGPIYADAVALSGVHRTLADSPIAEVNLQVTVRTTADRFADHDQLVRNEVARTVNATGAQVYRRGMSDSYALPFQEDEENVRNLAVFSFFDAFEEHVRLVEGDWPATTSEPYEAVLPASTAAQLELSIGDEFQVTNRRDESIQPVVRITGFYEINDATDPFWMETPLDIDGIIISDSFTTFGPFVVTADTFFDSFTPASSEVRWNILPEFVNLDVGEIAGMRRSVETLEDRLNRGTAAGNRFSVNTELHSILRAAERSLLVTRSGVLVLTIQLALLAGYALVLTAGLLVDQRGVETSLIRSRGASNRQVATMAMMEAMLLALPAIILGPILAALVLRILNIAGPLAGIGLHIEPQISSTAYLIAIGTGLACIVALTLPSLIAARSFTQARAERGRQGSRAFSQRAGIDLVLLGLAALAYWQLRRYSAPITQTVEGRLGIDPLLVAAPAIGLLAGAVIALRTIPLLARLAEVIAIRGATIVPALGAWQIARRPMRYARSALILVLALGIGLFAVSYSETWSRSQHDQAAYQTGGDIRVWPNQRIGRSIPRQLLPDAYSHLDGVGASMTIMRDSGQISRTAGTGQGLMLDAAVAADIVSLRSDLSDEPIDVLMERLVAKRTPLAGVPIPGEPAEIAFDVTFAVDPLPDDLELPEGIDLSDRRFQMSISMAIVVQDARGNLSRIDFRAVEENPDGTRLSAPVIYQMSDESAARPTYPLSIVAIELRATATRGITRTATLDIHQIEINESLGSSDWTAVELPTDTDFWELGAAGVVTLFEAPEIALTEPASGEGMGIALSSGMTTGNQPTLTNFYLRPAGTELPETIPVLVSQQFLDNTSSSIGSVSEIQIGDLRGRIEVVGVIAGFPTLDPNANGLFIADMATVAASRFEPGRQLFMIDEIWVGVDDSQVDAVVEALGQEPFLSRQVQSQDGRATTLLSDPVALGAIGALSIGFVAALIFAGVGFVVSSVVSARERMTEFALLRALGLSPRQLLRWMTLENSVLLGISLVFGTLLGLALAWLILPLISVTQQATRVFPGVIVVIPWRTILLLELGVVVVLVAVIGIMALALRKLGLGSLLRLGEDT